MEKKIALKKKVTLVQGKRGRVSYNHPWVYRSQIQEVVGGGPGEIYPLYSSRGDFLGRGYHNAKSEIAFRLLTYKDEEINAEFFKKRIEKALEFRRRYVSGTNAYRIIFSESDGIPGLIADQYGDTVVAQTLTLGIEQWKEKIYALLLEVTGARFLFERSDAPSRAKEGLAPALGWHGAAGRREIEIHEGNVKYVVDIEAGHKTGFYLDQRVARSYVGGYAKGRRVLDCCTYTGGFAISAACGGAREVAGIDVHEGHVDRARKNAVLNGIDPAHIGFKVANVFEALRECERKRERYDLIVLDPPSFVKSKNAIEGALAGYKEINLRSMKLLNPGGIIATFSCSNHVDEELFLQVVLDAAFDTHKDLKLLARLGQPLDHPVDPFIPQTSYLKGFVFEVN